MPASLACGKQNPGMYGYTPKEKGGLQAAHGHPLFWILPVIPRKRNFQENYFAGCAARLARWESTIRTYPRAKSRIRPRIP